MNFKTLYNRRSDGDLQRWDLELQDGKYRVSSGKVGGKIVNIFNEGNCSILDKDLMDLAWHW